MPGLGHNHSYSVHFVKLFYVHYARLPTQTHIRSTSITRCFLRKVYYILQYCMLAMEKKNTKTFCNLKLRKKNSALENL